MSQTTVIIPCLYLTDTPKHVVKGADVIRKGEDDEATNYFIDIFPRIKQKYQHGYINTSTGGLTELKYIEFLQHEGDTVFVPGGMYSAVQ